MCSTFDAEEEPRFGVSVRSKYETDSSVMFRNIFNKSLALFFINLNLKTILCITSRGWRRLVDCSVQDGLHLVSERLWDMHTLRDDYAWEALDGYEDRSDVLDAVVDILWGRKALVIEESGELRQRMGALDDDDMLYLRCLMRRYGWERFTTKAACCMWSEVFRKTMYNKKNCLDFAWFLLQKLLHPRRSVALDGLRAEHAPQHIRQLRAARLGWDFAFFSKAAFEALCYF